MKRLFDIFFSALGLFLLWPIILIAWIVASLETRSNGFFVQKRVGRFGHLISVLKIKTMRPVEGYTSTSTTSYDPRITRSGALFRTTKIDELPQLWNVLVGDMSFVGPRPDVPGYADLLQGEHRKILELRPGITGPASLKYRDEEHILAQQENPVQYNDEVIWPDKVRINLQYYYDHNIVLDVSYILKTIFDGALR